MQSNQFSKKFPARLASLLGVAILSAALAACGGGGGGGGSSGAVAAPTTPTGTTGGATAVLPVGTGVVSFSFGATQGEFVKVLPTGFTSTLSFPCATTDQGIISADLRADGMVVGLSTDLYTIDVINGNCKRIGTPPVALGSIAMAANGNVYGVSLRQDTNFLYHLIVLNPNDMSVLLDLPMTGGNIGFVKGIDFAPDGSLYMSTFDGTLNHEVFLVDIATGAVTPKFTVINPSGDIDIDSTGVLRINTTDQVIRSYNVSTGALLGTLALDRVTEKFLVYR